MKKREPPKHPIGKQLRALREHSKLRALDVANSIGIRESTYSMLERSHTEPLWANACALADLFSVTLDDLRGERPAVEEQEELEQKLIEAARTCQAGDLAAKLEVRRLAAQLAAAASATAALRAAATVASSRPPPEPKRRKRG